MIKQLEQSYSVNDKQDVLAMCALQFASKTKQRSIDNSNSNKSFEIKLKELNELISETISWFFIILKLPTLVFLINSTLILLKKVSLSCKIVLTRSDLWSTY